MSKTKFSISLPEEVVQILSTAKNKSAYIAEAIREKKRNEEKKRPKRKLEAAYKEVAEEDYELYKEWEDTLGDGIES